MMYLQQPRYLEATMVRTLTDAMLAISFPDLLERFAAMEHLNHEDDVLKIAQHPAYQPIMAEFERLLCFFHVAATLKYGVIRWYSG